MHRIRGLWLWVLPKRLFYADHFTVSARRMFTRMGIGSFGLLVGLASAGLLESTNWADVFAGALLAWGVSIIVWAVSSYRGAREEIRDDLRRTAEVDLLHARLNQIAIKVGAKCLVLDHELEHALGARMERLAHFAGLDEFREESHATTEGYAYWDGDALGRTERQQGDSNADP